MREAVLIKSFPNGITLRLDGELPFEELLTEISYKFSEARAFFGKVSMALSIEGREVSPYGVGTGGDQDPERNSEQQ